MIRRFFLASLALLVCASLAQAQVTSEVYGWDGDPTLDFSGPAVTLTLTSYSGGALVNTQTWDGVRDDTSGDIYLNMSEVASYNFPSSGATYCNLTIGGYDRSGGVVPHVSTNFGDCECTVTIGSGTPKPDESPMAPTLVNWQPPDPPPTASPMDPTLVNWISPTERYERSLNFRAVYPQVPVCP